MPAPVSEPVRSTTSRRARAPRAWPRARDAIPKPSHPQTVMGWVHAYNAQGPDALGFRRTGGRPPFALRLRRRFETPSAPPSVRPPPQPREGADPAPRWTLKRLMLYVRERFG